MERRQSRKGDRLTVASLEQITAWLEEFDTEPERVIARTLEFKGGGGSGAWACDCDDEAHYIVKAQNNHHEQDAPRLKVVTTELVCGRLGQLFKPPVTPDTRVVMLPTALTSAVTYPSATAVHPTSGTACGSKLIEGVVETKSGQTDAVAPETVAAVVAFQSWLAAQDPAALIQVDTGALYSMDHAWYLTGPRWQLDVLDAEPAGSACLNMIGPNVSRFSNRSVFATALQQLAELPEDSIVRAFSSIPEDWGADRPFRARLARYTLRRREYVEAALATLWTGTT